MIILYADILARAGHPVDLSCEMIRFDFCADIMKSPNSPWSGKHSGIRIPEVDQNIDNVPMRTVAETVLSKMNLTFNPSGLSKAATFPSGRVKDVVDVFFWMDAVKSTPEVLEFLKDNQASMIDDFSKHPGVFSALEKMLKNASLFQMGYIEQMYRRFPDIFAKNTTDGSLSIPDENRDVFILKTLAV